MYMQLRPGRNYAYNDPWNVWGVNYFAVEGEGDLLKNSSLRPSKTARCAHRRIFAGAYP